MTYEKTYEEALERAKKIYNRGYYIIGDLERIFPELKESEDECIEKIKKEIISYLNNRKIDSIPESNATEKWIDWIKKQKPIINKEDEEVRQYLIRTMKQNDINVPMVQKALAWLEKQGEQKPAWSEEDERMYRGLHNLIYSTQYCDSRKELSDWLKSIKQRIKGE